MAELARRQHGIVTSAQLGALGLGARAAQKRAEAGRLHRLHPGVYAVGHTSLTMDGRRLAAVLAAGPHAALSHRSAAVVWDLRRGPETRIELSTSDRGRTAPRGTTLHRVRGPLDCVVRDAIPVTTVARTLLDLADVVSPQALTRAVHEAERLRLVDMREMEAMLAEAKGRRTRRLAAALATRDPGPTRSRLEEVFADLVARSDLPAPRRNVHVDVGERLVEVDVLWPERRVAVELDGAESHRTRRAFEADRARDAALLAAGYRVLRLTWRRVTREPDEVRHELRRILAEAARTHPLEARPARRRRE